MEFGTDQLNTFDTFTLDCWKDRVYYEGQSFPAGYFAAEILNFAGEADDPILEHIIALPPLVSQAAALKKDGGRDVLAQLRPLMHKAVSWICTCPPFCCGDVEFAWREFNQAMDGDCFDRDCDISEDHLPYRLLMFSDQILKILVSIYNFCLLIRAFEKRYLRRLKRRTESEFAKAAHTCFDLDNDFLDITDRMPFGEMEEFFSFPRLISGFSYLQDPHDKEKWISVQQVICKRLIDFYVFDLQNGFQHGHGPSFCQNCHRYFLTTTAHVPKYCDGMAPQDHRLTCRQYGTMMHQKEQNKQHPVYRLFSTRTNTIRKHHQRGKISDELRREALYLAETYRDRALMDNDYAAGDYVHDMEQETLYAQARARLAQEDKP